jgi:hypothetical protein
VLTIIGSVVCEYLSREIILSTQPKKHHTSPSYDDNGFDLSSEYYYDVITRCICFTSTIPIFGATAQYIDAAPATTSRRTLLYLRNMSEIIPSLVSKP